MTLDKGRTILQVDTEHGWRGGEAQVLLLCRGLLARGFRPLLVCQPASALGKKARAEGVSVRDLRMRGEYDLRAAWRLRKIIRSEQAQICHAHTAHAHALLWLATAGTRHHLVVSRRVDFAVRKNMLSRRKYLSPRVHFIGISTGVSDVLCQAGIPAERISIVPSGIDVNKFSTLSRDQGSAIRSEFNIPADSHIIGNIAHLADHKGHRYLIDAAAAVLKQMPKVVFLIVGEGEEREALEHRIARLGLQQNVILAGFRENVAPFLASFDLFALSSHLEGLCTSLLDAMLAGVPVVATRTGGVPDIVTHNVSGLLVEPRNPAPLAEGILRLLRNRQFAAQLARNARDTVLGRFTADTMVEGTIAIYQKILADRRSCFTD